MEKERYTSLTLLIVRFEAQDVITRSGGDEDEGEPMDL